MNGFIYDPDAHTVPHVWKQSEMHEEKLVSKAVTQTYNKICIGSTSVPHVLQMRTPRFTYAQTVFQMYTFKIEQVGILCSYKLSNITCCTWTFVLGHICTIAYTSYIKIYALTLSYSKKC